MFPFLVPGSLPYLAKVARMGQHVRTCQAPTSAIAHQVIKNLTSLKTLLSVFCVVLYRIFYRLLRGIFGGFLLVP